MKIWRATSKDKLSIEKMMWELDEYRDNTFSYDNKEFHLKLSKIEPALEENFEKGLYFFAWEDNELLWFISWTCFERKNHKLWKLWYIDELYVKEEGRWKWIAGRLFEVLETEFRKKGCDHIITHTDAENELSKTFYNKAWMNCSTIEFWKELK